MLSLISNSAPWKAGLRAEVTPFLVELMGKNTVQCYKYLIYLVELWTPQMMFVILEDF